MTDRAKKPDMRLDFSAGSPESIFTRFMFAWKKREIKNMLDMCSRSWIEKRPKAKEKLELWFGDIYLMGMKIIKVQKTDKRAKVTTKIAFRKFKTGSILSKRVSCELICERGAFDIHKGGDWRVNPVSLFIEIYDLLKANSTPTASA